MNKAILTVLSVIVLSGCAHKELKAPCANIASLTAASVPCSQRQPANTPRVPSFFAE